MNLTRPTIVYLAGPIRDGRAEDLQWRRRIATALEGRAVWISPTAAKVYHPAERRWTVGGWPSDARLIVHHDLWAVDRADIVVAHLGALRDEHYPSIGTLIELGRAGARGVLCYGIAPPSHPFLDTLWATVFPDVETAIPVLGTLLDALSGRRPLDGEEGAGWPVARDAGPTATA